MKKRTGARRNSWQEDQSSENWWGQPRRPSVLGAAPANPLSWPTQEKPGKTSSLNGRPHHPFPSCIIAGQRKSRPASAVRGPFFLGRGARLDGGDFFFFFIVVAKRRL